MMSEYKKNEFCISLQCGYVGYVSAIPHCNVSSDSKCIYTAKQFHKWLKRNNFKIVKGESTR